MKRTFDTDFCLGNIPNQEIYGQMLSYAKDKGIPIYKDMLDTTFNKFPNLVFTNNYLCGNNSYRSDSRVYWITFEQFFEYCDNWKEEQPKKVSLNKDYTAEIKDGKVIVGCQVFEFEVIRKLYDAINENS